MVDVLPAPLWPMKPNTSPRRTAKLTLSTASVLPKVLGSPMISIALPVFMQSSALGSGLGQCCNKRLRPSLVQHSNIQVIGRT